MRTTPLEKWKDQAAQFDRMIRRAIENILGFPMSDFTFAQACLTPKLGGLGLRRVVEHADLAYQASWHESQATAREAWIAPPGMPGEAKNQSEASYEFDEKVHAWLVNTAPNDREAQRLRRCAQPHAGCFITALPSEEDGRDTILKPRNFRIAVAYRLGVHVIDREISCPLCMQTIDKFGDHATCCSKRGSLLIRHNAVRDLVALIAQEGLLNPQLEKQGILGPTTGRRPGDVTIPNWNGGGLAIDVAVTSPLTKGNTRVENPGEEYARSQKHGKYDAGFVGQSYSFCAMVFETLGALNSEGEDVLHSLFRFAAKQLGREFTSYCGRAWARMSCTLQRSVSQAILTRIDGRELPRIEPSGPDNFVSIPEPVPHQPPPLALDSAFLSNLPASSVSLPAPSIPAPLPVSIPAPLPPSIPTATPASAPVPSTFPACHLGLPCSGRWRRRSCACRRRLLLSSVCCVWRVDRGPRLVAQRFDLLFASGDHGCPSPHHGQHQRVHRLCQVYLR